MMMMNLKKIHLMKIHHLQILVPNVSFFRMGMVDVFYHKEFHDVSVRMEDGQRKDRKEVLDDDV